MVHDRAQLIASNASQGPCQNPLGYQVGEGMSTYQKMSPHFHVEPEMGIFSAIDGMFVSPQSSYIEISTPKAMV